VVQARPPPQGRAAGVPLGRTTIVFDIYLSTGPPVVGHAHEQTAREVSDLAEAVRPVTIAVRIR